MKTRFHSVRVMALLAVLLCALLFTASVGADSFNTDFETYTIGNINGQDGWMKTGGYDAAIVDQASLGLTYPGFDSRSLRISNAVTSGSFGDQTFSRSLVDEAGETAAQNGGMSGGTRQPYYEASFEFASADPTVEQVGLMVGVSPDRGDGARMSLFRLYDLPAGLAVEFYDFDRDRPGNCVDGLDFQSTMVATGLARGVVHNVRITMQFVDGIDNDIVKVYVDGTLVHTGQSWEDYFVDCELNPTRTVDSLLFRASGTAKPSLAGKGFLIDNFAQYSGPVPCTDLIVPCVLYVSTKTAGVTDDNLAFGPHDILQWDGLAWSKWFDGSAAGLMPNGRNKHDLAAIYIPDPAGEDVVLGFVQNLRKVPDITGKVDGMDLVWWDGSAFSLFFDGQDVGLTVKTHEKIDALHILDGSLSPVGSGCLNYLLISTQGPGRVPGVGKFGGEDVLGFCQTSIGTTTTGFWHLLLDGSAEGMPANSTNGLSFSADGQTMYLTTHATFNVDTASGSHSMVYRYDFASGEFSGPYFVATDAGLHEKVNGLHIDLFDMAIP